MHIYINNIILPVRNICRQVEHRFAIFAELGPYTLDFTSSGRYMAVVVVRAT